jgi:hypothetical protein
MTAKFKIGLRIPLILTVVFSGIVAHGQAAQPTPNNDALAVSLKMQTEQIQVGQMPWAILTVYNLSDQPVTIGDSVYRVSGSLYATEHGPRPSLARRQASDRLSMRNGQLRITRDRMREAWLLLFQDGSLPQHNATAHDYLPQRISQI